MARLEVNVWCSSRGKSDGWVEETLCSESRRQQLTVEAIINKGWKAESRWKTTRLIGPDSRNDSVNAPDSGPDAVNAAAEGRRAGRKGLRVTRASRFKESWTCVLPLYLRSNRYNVLGPDRRSHHHVDPPSLLPKQITTSSSRCVRSDNVVSVFFLDIQSDISS